MPQISPRKAKNNQILALLFVWPIFVLFITIIWKVNDPTQKLIFSIVGLFLSFRIYSTLTAKYRNRKKVLSEPISSKWQLILAQHVEYYQHLSPKERIQFKQNIQIFLAEKQITGIKTTIDDKIKVLVAASAIIPIFGFKEWEYDNLGEILVYPNSFSNEYNLEGPNRNIAGMVGSGHLNGVMILSKNAILQGFANERDGQNTAIHEFVHLIDGRDGTFDGIPSLLDKQYIIPWLDLMYDEIDKIKNKESSIDSYGATNKVEFFAVASEFFFEKPKVMKSKYPELHQMLSTIFHQDLSNRIKYQFKDLLNISGKRIGRNTHCPCGSGDKYKHCCLD